MSVLFVEGVESDAFYESFTYMDEREGRERIRQRLHAQLGQSEDVSQTSDKGMDIDARV